MGYWFFGVLLLVPLLFGVCGCSPSKKPSPVSAEQCFLVSGWLDGGADSRVISFSNMEALCAGVVEYPGQLPHIYKCKQWNGWTGYEIVLDLCPTCHVSPVLCQPKGLK